MPIEVKLSDRQKTILQEMISRHELDDDASTKAQILLDVAGGADEQDVVGAQQIDRVLKRL